MSENEVKKEQDVTAEVVETVAAEPVADTANEPREARRGSRERNPRLERILCMCVVAVRREMPRLTAIWASVIPRAASRATSCSRSESAPSPRSRGARRPARR